MADPRREWPWEIVSRLRAQGCRFELTEDRTGFYVRGAPYSSADRALITANRERILQHLQHLDPPETFRRQALLGFPGFDAPRKAYPWNRVNTESSSLEAPIAAKPLSPDSSPPSSR